MSERASIGGRARRLLGILAVTVVTAAQLASGGPARGVVSDVSSEPVSFTVHNINRSRVPCAGDGATYTIAGHLVGPTGLSGRGPHAVTLYLHGLGYGQFFWNFTTVRGYDFAVAQARAGHASVVIDRLGYGASGHPAGSRTCVGAQADIAHQIVQQLRAGSYTAAGSVRPAFGRVALAGHSAGGAVAEIEAYSFRDIDALVIMAWADLGASPAAALQFARTGGVCLGGGQPAGPGEPGGYAFFGQRPQDFDAAMFHHADPAVEAAATAMRLPDPCGDTNSIPVALAVDVISVPTITVPVILAYGANDALFPPPAGTLQRLLFRGSSDVHALLLAGTGHAVTLELTAPTLQARMAAWLGARGL